MMTYKKREVDERNGDLFESLGRLGKAIGPFGVPFALIFMGNVLIICMVLFYQINLTICS